MELKSMKKKLAREQAASILREAILTKQLKEGDALTLKTIADQIGVSNTPIREAFQILANEGLIQLEANKGATVNRIDQKYIRDYYHMRIVLESACVEEICERKVNLAEIEEMCTQCKKCIDAKNYTEYQEYNFLFHQSIWIAADNDRITSLLVSLWVGSFISINNSEETHAKTSCAEHQQILESLKDYNAKQTTDFMRKHINRSMENTLAFLNF